MKRINFRKLNNQDFFVAVLVTSIFVSAIVGFAAGQIGNGSALTFSKQNLSGESSDLDHSLRALVEQERVVVDIVDRTIPAVVSVAISKNVPIIERCFVSPFQDNPLFKKFFGDVRVPAECQRGFEKREVGGGSGFIVSHDGLILTNKHLVLDESADYTVITNDGQRFDAEVLARDPLNDLAVLKIDANNLSILPFGNSDGLRIGQTVIAIGNALGQFQNTVSLGVISGLSRSITARGPGLTEELTDIIQTDAAINPGNSGGPLINLSGEVIGVNTAVAQSAENIGFSIPVNEAVRAVESVQREGRIVYPLLGVRFVTLTREIAEENNLPVDEGAWLRPEAGESPVLPGSPAEEAGLEPGDIIIAINSEQVAGNSTLADLLQEHRVGDTINIVVRREGQEIQLQATLVEREF